MTGMPWERPMAMISSMSHGLPSRCTIMIARVRAVILRSMSAGSMLKVSGSMSANTGTAFCRTIPLTVPMGRHGRGDHLIARARGRWPRWPYGTRPSRC